MTGRTIESLCLFCGSSPGRDDVYLDAARELGRLLASEGIRLVYGGGRVGLMGAAADAALADGGEVIGVIPQALWDREVGHSGLTELHIVQTMHQRKARMVELSDGFAAMPGGIGTLDELFEVWTWGQLGIHGKPFGLLNVHGYFDSLLAFLDHVATERFLPVEHRSLLVTESRPDALLAKLRAFRPPPVEKWVDLDRS
jgi:uncharacterized protein (TIGR00730 family)